MAQVSSSEESWPAGWVYGVVAGIIAAVLARWIGDVAMPAAVLVGLGHYESEVVVTLDVDGYTATNILRFIAPRGRQIVYLPGAAVAFTVLETELDMHYWVLQQMNEESMRRAFMAHFSLADRQTIADNITDIMNRLVSTCIASFCARGRRRLPVVDITEVSDNTRSG